MNARRVHLELIPVPAGYSPRYPRRLTPAEFRALIAPGTRFRVRRAALAASLAFAPAAQVATAGDRPAAPANVASRVLAALRSLADAHPPGTWYTHALTQQDPQTGKPSFTVPICFGNSMNGMFDAERARGTARELFAAYGVTLEKDARVDLRGVHAELDGLARETGLGFELRGGAPGSEGHTGLNGERLHAKPEEDRDWLADDEAADLPKLGLEVHVGNVEMVPDGDHFTAMLPWLAAIIDFLNQHTDGPDVDLSGLLWGDKLRLPLPAPIVPADPTDMQVAREVKERETLRLPFGAGSGPGAVAERRDPKSALRTEEWIPAAAIPSTRGVIAVLVLGVWPNDQTTQRPALRLSQGSVHVESRSSVLFTPPEFDAAKPFTLELVLEPGIYTINRHLLIGAPAKP